MAGRGGRGGKTGKRKGQAAGKRELEFKEDGEEYAQVLKLLGKLESALIGAKFKATATPRCSVLMERSV